MGQLKPPGSLVSEGNDVGNWVKWKQGPECACTALLMESATKMREELSVPVRMGSVFKLVLRHTLHETAFV